MDVKGEEEGGLATLEVLLPEPELRELAPAA